jgi:hypothetical protein
MIFIYSSKDFPQTVVFPIALLSSIDVSFFAHLTLWATCNTGIMIQGINPAFGGIAPFF